MSSPIVAPDEAKILPVNSHESEDNNASSDTGSVCSIDSDNNEVQKESSDQEVLDEVEEGPAFALRMLNLCKEIAIFALVVVTYAALTNDPPKITKIPSAYPFFPKDSVVVDWYRGQISKAIEHARNSDIAFVMFYAPWDAESQAARKEFELTARHMHRFVKFAAVNCWQPKSECRNQYSKVYKWPVLIAYPSYGRGIQYNGPMSALHMIKFLQKICWPLTRIEADGFREYEDAYIVAHLNATPGSLDFAVYYTTALKYLEKDPSQSITFYVNVANLKSPSLFLNLWNETLMYPSHELEWRPDTILHWLYKSIHQVTAWVAPSGSKSLSLASVIQPGPSLILFTPKNPLHPFNDYYNMFQEVGQEYYNCVNEYIMDSVHTISKRHINTVKYQQLLRACSRKVDKPFSNKISQLKPKTWLNNSYCVNKKCDADIDECNLLSRQGIYSCGTLMSSESIGVSTLYREDYNKGCDKIKFNVDNIYKTSMLTGENDPRSPENLVRLFEKEKCRQFIMAQKVDPIVFDKTFYTDDHNFNITALACQTNRSLAFVAMNSLIYYHFAEKLGIDLLKKHHRSTAVIINDKMESHYILDDMLNGKNLRMFIYNFTKNTLARALNSSISVKSENTHVYPADNHLSVKSDYQIFVKELTTQTFLPIVLQKNKAVTVLYHSKQCYYCGGISHIFLSAARKLAAIDTILFARIDGELNILPWEYTMEYFPTIIFFPAHRKSESRIFPRSIPVSVPNLMGFILSNLEPGLKLQVMWSICNESQFEVEKTSCMTALRLEMLTMIDDCLRLWRISSGPEKSGVLYKLKQLRHLHLLFAHSPKREDLILDYFKKLISKPDLVKSEI